LRLLRCRDGPVIPATVAYPRSGWSNLASSREISRSDCFAPRRKARRGESDRMNRIWNIGVRLARPRQRRASQAWLTPGNYHEALEGHEAYELTGCTGWNRIGSMGVPHTRDCAAQRTTSTSKFVDIVRRVACPACRAPMQASCCSSRSSWRAVAFLRRRLRLCLPAPSHRLGGQAGARYPLNPEP